jgi:hypothetical protein
MQEDSRHIPIRGFVAIAMGSGPLVTALDAVQNGRMIEFRAKGQK